MRWYLHIDMDAFYASVEQALDPGLEGKAVIVGGRNGRGVVTSASYEARKFGVRSAMPGFLARQLCPHGVFLPNRRRVYCEFSAKVFAILEQYSPAVRALSIDEGLVDLTGTERLFGPPLKTADTMIRRLASELHLPSSAGLSTNRTTAKIAATLAKPHGLIYVPHGSEKDFLAPLAVDLIPGVGRKTHRLFNQKGIHSIGDLLQRTEIARRFLDLTEGARDRRQHDHSVGSETTLAQPVTDVASMERVLWELIEEVGGRLRREKLYAGWLTVKIRYTDFHTITRSRTLAEPTCFDKEIFAVVSGLLKRNVVHGRPVRLLGVSAGVIQCSGWQESLLNGTQRRSYERLYKAIDDLRLRYGENAIGAATPRRRGG